MENNDVTVRSELRRLREVATIVAGTKPTEHASARAQPFQVISLKDVGRQIAARDTLRTVSSRRNEISRYCVAPGDVVVTTRGTDIRAAVVSEAHAGAVVGANLAAIRLDSMLSPVLLAAFLREPRTRARLLRDTAGASTPGFTIKVLGDLTVCIPPIERQRTLVRFIEAEDAYREALAQSMRLREKVCSDLIANELLPREPRHA